MKPIIGKKYKLNNSPLINNVCRGREFTVISIERDIISINFTDNNEEAYMNLHKWGESVESQLSNIGNSKLEFKFL